MVNEDANVFSSHRAFNEELVARLEVRVVGDDQWMRARLRVAEEARIVDQGHVDAASVGRVVVNVLEIHLLGRRRVDEVAHDAFVFNLRNADDGRTARAVWTGEVADDACHVVQLLLIFFLRPLVWSGRQVFVIALVVGVVFIVEKVFEVVEDHAPNAHALRQCGGNGTEQQD